MIRRLFLLWALACAPAAQADGFAPITAVAPQTPLPMMVNLSGLDDWGTQQPFIDRMKVARPWIGHMPGRWGGMTHDDLAAQGVLDDNGWPKRIPGDLTSIATLIMTDLPEEATDLAGRYILRFEGNGIVEVAGRASAVRYGPNQVRFAFTPGPGAVEVKIQRSDRAGTGDYVRNITIVREDRMQAFDMGALFNPDFLDVIMGFEGLRFMDWMKTNFSTQSDWAHRPKTGDYSYAWRGIPVEMLVELSNRVGAAPWLTLPHKADDRYFRNAAQIVFDQLDPTLPVYVEYSNEVWNWGFDQSTWAEEQSMARWGHEYQWMQFYGMRAAQMAQIWRDVFADRPDQLTTVLGTQIGWMGLEEQLLHAPLWQAEGNPAPHTFFDAYAITGYVSAALGYEEQVPMIRAWLVESEARARANGQDQGLTGDALAAHIETHKYDHAFARAAAELYDGRISGKALNTVTEMLTETIPYHLNVAAAYDLDLVMYEGGSHVVGIGPVVEFPEIDAFFRALNYSEEMGIIYTHLLAGWADLTDTPFTHFNDVVRPSKWGSWGALRHLSDDNPRWQVMMQYRKGTGG